MAQLHRSLATLALVTLISLSTSKAHADPDTLASSNAQAAASTKASIEKDPIPEPPKDDFKHVSITTNPLSLILGRIGLNVEYLPVRHHAIVLNPYFHSGSATSESSGTTLDSKLTSLGTELGYRLYSGTEGANGVFISPAVFVQRSNAKTTATTSGASSMREVDMFAYGGILDIGGQFVTSGGFTLGAGAGVMYFFGSAKGVASSSTLKVEGVLPRVLLTVGYSF